ncbi:MAG: serine protease, partial [Chloroflexi bacterium]
MDKRTKGMDDIRKSIVGILAEPGSGYAYTGTGFLAEGGVLVTCAHVLEQARRDGEAYLFQFDGENETRQAFLIRQSAKDDLDLAVLKPKSLPTEAVALKLVQPVNIRKLAFEVYGYPQKAGFRGRYADGALQGELTDVQGRAAFQIKSEQVEKGFSGAPLYVAELDGVVAIVSSGPGARFGLADQVTAYAIPVRQLEAVYSRFNIQTGQSAAGWYMAHHYSLRPNF